MPSSNMGSVRVNWSGYVSQSRANGLLMERFIRMKTWVIMMRDMRMLSFSSLERMITMPIIDRKKSHRRNPPSCPAQNAENR